jgi:exonuclease VII small subunit
MTTDPHRLDDLAGRLDVIAEELGDLALEELRSAVERGQSARPAAEKRLTQARRAVEKASHLLQAEAGGGGHDRDADDD